METRQSKKGKNKKKYNPYGEEFIINRIVLSNMMESLVGLDEIAVPREIDLVNDMDQDWIDDHSEPEIEFEPEVQQTHEQELTKLRVLEWHHDLPADSKETILTIQDVDKDGIKYVSHDNTDQLGRPRWPSTRSTIQPRSAQLWAIDWDVDGYFCPGSGGRTHRHRKPDH